MVLGGSGESFLLLFCFFSGGFSWDLGEGKGGEGRGGEDKI